MKWTNQSEIFEKVGENLINDIQFARQTRYRYATRGPFSINSVSQNNRTDCNLIVNSIFLSSVNLMESMGFV